VINVNELGLMNAAAPATGPLRTYGILVVDDEAGVRGVLKVWMRQQGLVVWVAANGQEAVDLYLRHRQSIDVVLMDVRMPRLDGPQTLTAMKQLNPQVRCCFMSGDLGCYTLETLQNLGATAVLRKPFDFAEVARALGEQVSKTDATPFASRCL
jgi:CheY-like chemotaxis protein